jgi:hypothetical protein
MNKYSGGARNLVCVGAAMLRDMICSAWLESANLDAPLYPTK